MSTFDFVEKSLVSNDERYTLTKKNCQYIKNFKQEKDVFSLDNSEKNAYLTGVLDFDSQVDNFIFAKVGFSIDKKTENNALFVKIINPQFQLKLKKKNDQYAIFASITIGEKEKTMSTDYIFDSDIWYDLQLAIGDGEMDVIVDNRLYIRRVFFEDEIFNKDFTTRIFLGGEREETNGFCGKFSYLEADNNFSDQIMEKLKEAEENGFGDAESKYQDLEQEGIYLEDLLATHPKTPTTNHCYYGFHLYEGGAVFWHSVYPTTYISKDLYIEYERRGSMKKLGYPLFDMNPCENNPGVTYGIFEKGALFLFEDKPSILLSSEILSYYMEEGIEDSFLGLPSSQERNFLTGKMLLCENGAIFYKEDLGIITMDRDFYDYYSKHSNQFGFPLSSVSTYSKFYSTKQKKLVTTESYWDSEKHITVLEINKLSCELGDIYQIKKEIEQNGTSRQETLYYYLSGAIAKAYNEIGGPASESGYPIGFPTVKSGIHYCNFSSGVIIKYPNQEEVVIHNKPLVLQLTKIRSGSIDDGFQDTTAEVKAWAWWTHEGKEEEKIYSPGAGRKGGSTFYFSSDRNKWSIFPLTGETNFQVDVKVEDYDRWSGNEYLGNFTFHVNIENGFQLDRPEDWGGSHTMNLTHEGRDNRGGLDNIQLDYSLFEDYGKDFTKNPDFVLRRDGFWPFHNFSNHLPSPLISHTTITNTFANGEHSTPFWDLFNLTRNAIFITDHLKNSGKKGHCFGLTVEALYSLHHISNYHLPLSKHVPKHGFSPKNGTFVDYEDFDNKALAETIQRKHLYQSGIYYIFWRLSQKICSPGDSINKIKKLIEKEHYVCITLGGGKAPKGEKKPGGHAVLGYKVDKRTNRIYVADSNFPYNWCGNDTDHCSYIEPVDSSSVNLITEISTDYKYTRTYSRLSGVPFSLLSRPPLLPSLFQLLIRGCMELLLLSYDSDTSCEEITVDETTLYNQEENIIDDSVLLLPGYDDKSMIIIKRSCKDISFKMKGEKNGDYESSMFMAGKVYKIKTQTTPGETDLFSVKNLQSSYPNLEVSSTKEKVATITMCPLLRKKGKKALQFTTGIHLDGYKKFIKEEPFTRRLLLSDESGEELPCSYRLENAPKFLETFDSNKSDKNRVYKNANGKIMFVKDLATYTGYSKSTIYRWCHSGLVKGAVKRSYRWYIPSSARWYLPKK